MQTDRQDLDKRYINLLCVEPHITLPDCNGSLKLTEYGHKVSYESETDCADINETCTIIEKEISKRPEAGDPGGLPDIEIPDISSFACGASNYQFGETTLLSDGRMLILHYQDGNWKRGYLYLALVDVGGASPVELTNIRVETPTGDDVYAYEAIDIVALRDDTFVIALFGTQVGNKSVLMVGSVTVNVLSFDYILTTLDSTFRMDNVSLSGDGSNVFGVFYNVDRIGYTPDWETPGNSVYFKSYSYDGANFALLGSYTVAPRLPISVRVPPAYVPLTDWDEYYCCPFPIPADAGYSCCVEGLTDLEDIQARSSDMDFMREEGNSYLFAGGFVQPVVLTKWMDYFFSHCLVLPTPRYKEILINVSFKVNKSGGVTITEFTPHRFCLAQGSRLECIAIAPSKLITLVQRPLAYMPEGYDERIYVMGFEIDNAGGMYAGNRIKSLKIDENSAASHAYRIDDERFAVAVSDGNAKVYPMAWTDNYFGVFADIYTVDLSPQATPVILSGERIQDGRLCVNSTRTPGFAGVLCLLDVSDV
jgi:hypothetical protein